MGGRNDFRFFLSSRRWGTSFEATDWRTLDPCGLAGISCTLGVHLFAFGTIATQLIEGSMLSTAIFVLIYTPVASLALASLYKAWSTDPGAVPMGARPLVTVKRASSGEITASNSRQRALRRCPKCNDNYKPNRAHHDSVTGRCIVKFDHFCPWVGNAVGALNHKFFVLFVGYTMCTCILSLLLIFLRALYCGWVSDDSDDPEVPVQSTTNERYSGAGDEEEDPARRFLEVVYRPECTGFYSNLSALALLIVSVVFMIFTGCMLVEQIEAISTNNSKIARMKMRVGQAGTELARVTEEFNEMFGGASNEVAWHWFVPMEVRFPRSMQKVVLGYEWDETFDPVPYEEPTATIHTSNGMSAGGGSIPAVDEEKGISLELTPTSTRRTPSSVEIPPAAASPAIRATSTGSTSSSTTSAEGKSSLKQRGGSRGPDSRLKPAPGTFA